MGLDCYGAKSVGIFVEGMGSVGLEGEGAVEGLEPVLRLLDVSAAGGSVARELGDTVRDGETCFEGLEVLDFLPVVFGQLLRESKRDLGVLQRYCRHASAAVRTEVTWSKHVEWEVNWSSNTCLGACRIK